MGTELVVVTIAFFALLGTLIGFTVKFSRGYGKLEEKTLKNEENIKENAKNTGQLWDAFRSQVGVCNGQRSGLLMAVTKLETTVEALVESSKLMQEMLQSIQKEIYSIRGKHNE